jgi:hypothetical protein
MRASLTEPASRTMLLYGFDCLQVAINLPEKFRIPA